jgi:hypothetical protein
MSQLVPRIHGTVALERWQGSSMDVGVVVGGVIVLLAMVGISVYGWVTLPPGAQVPLHHGIGGYGNWQPKTIALISYPVIGALVFAVVLGATSRASSSGPTVIAPLAILVAAVSQYFAVRAAINNGNRVD